MFRLPILQYQLSDLVPFLSEEQMNLHYEKHHGTYIDNVNKAIQGKPKLAEISIEDLILQSSGPLFNNAAQAWNHTFYWFNMIPHGQGGRASKELTGACESAFGSFEKMFGEFVEAGVRVFGSGWVWLCADQQSRLKIITTPNADVPWKGTNGLRPLMVADVWEHAYYVDYHNQRKSYLEAMRTYLNWNFINENFASRYMKSLHRYMHAEHPLSQAI